MYNIKKNIICLFKYIDVSLKALYLIVYYYEIIKIARTKKNYYASDALL